MQIRLLPLMFFLMTLTTLLFLTATAMADAQRDKNYFEIYDRLVRDYGDHPVLGEILKNKRSHYRDKTLSHTYDFSASPWVTPEVRDAWIQGYTGKGITIEIRDDYQGRYVESQGRQYYMPAHGEFVHMIIAGGQLGNTVFTGIAPDATIIRNRKTVGGYADTVDIVNESNSGGRYLIPNENILEETWDFWDAYWEPYIGWPMHRTRTFAHHQRLLVLKSPGNRSTYTCKVDDYCTTSSFNLLGERNHAENSLLVGQLRWGLNYGTKAGVLKDFYVVDNTQYSFVWDEDGTPRQMRFGGASAAVPTASAKAALIRSKFPQLTGPEVAEIIKRTAHDLGEEGVDDYWGYGQVNLARALSEGPIRERTAVVAQPPE